MTAETQVDPIDQALMDYMNMSNPDIMPTETPVDDSADMPADETPKSAATDDTRTDFRGVYVNTHSNKDRYKYRCSISQYDAFSKQSFWINLGYFNCPLVAALAYNTAALGIYLGKAKINRVKVEDCATGELDDFKKKRALRIAIAQLVLRTMQENGEQVQYVS